MLRKLKSQKGFTLVEVIVVAVIVLILAAVAIPLYNGYITDSRRNVAENTAGSLASALAASMQQDPTNDFATSIGADKTGVITLPALTAGTSNIFRVPTDYSVTVNATAVTCKHTKDAKALSNAYVYNVGS